MEFDREFMINRLNNPSSDDKFARPKSTITNLKNKKPDYTTNQSLELSQASKDTLDAIEKKAKELGKKVLFIATPYVPDESQIREHLAVRPIAGRSMRNWAGSSDIRYLMKI